MTDTSTRVAGRSFDSTLPNCVEFTRTSSTLPGEVLAAGSAGVVPGRANNSATANLLGLSIGAAAANEPGFARYAGPLTLTEDEWDAVAGTDGGLTQGAYYYLSQATAGHLTETAPVSGISVPIGVALSSTTLVIGTPPQTTVGG